MSWINKMKLPGVKTIYFDFDGTLHNSIKIYSPAFRKAYDFLVDNKKAEPREWKDEEISRWLGYTKIEMWDDFMNNLDEIIKDRAGAIIGREMQDLMLSGNGCLYENTTEVLQSLKKRGFKLVFLSNCSIRYMEAAIAAFNLDDYFDDMICAEMYDFIPKHEILKVIKDKYPANQVIVGDRFHDIEAGVENGIYSVYCEYGYGEEKEGHMASAKIKDIRELLSLI
jgi:phosphoglycolate phosphatase